MTSGILPLRALELPEFAEYHDKGCSVSASCFTCPLPHCRYDAPADFRRLLSQQRAQKVKEMSAAGASPGEIAARLGISRRRVYFLLKGEKR